MCNYMEVTKGEGEGEEVTKGEGEGEGETMIKDITTDCFKSDVP